MNEEKYNEEYFAVLLKKVYLSDISMVCIPECLIEGKLALDSEMEEEYFINSYGEEYDLMEKADSTDTCVGYLVSKKTLRGRYPEVSIEVAASQYYEELKQEIHLGILSLDEEVNEELTIFDLEFSEFFNSLSAVSGSVQPRVEVPVYDSSVTDTVRVPNENHGESLFLAFSMKGVDDLLASKSFEEMKEKVEKAKADFIKASKHHENLKILGKKNLFTKEEYPNEETIEALFKIYAETFQNCKDVSEYQKYLSDFRAHLVELQAFLKSEGEEIPDYRIGFSVQFLEDFIQVCDASVGLEDYSILHEGICTVFEKHTEDIQKLVFQYTQFLQAAEELKKDDSISDRYHIRKIHNFLNEYVIGQEEAKKRIASALVSNFMMDDPKFKNTCLMIGPTGCGKTHIAKTLSKYFDVPFTIVDSTQLTKQGYKGADPETFLERLLLAANGDVQKAQNGIILFDEIDKKTSDNDDVSGKSVIDMLLLFIEGTTYKINYKNRSIPFDTSNLKILAMGSFEDMVKRMGKDSKGYSGTSMGFNSDLKKNTTEEDIVYPRITLEDLRKYANLGNEFLGRTPVIVQLDGHTKESLRQVLLNAKENPLQTEVATFQKWGVDLYWTDGYLDKVTDKAILRKQGARSLKSIIESTVWAARDEANNGYFEGKEYASVTLTENTVDNPYDVVFTDVYGNKTCLMDLLTENEKQMVKRIGNL